MNKVEFKPPKDILRWWRAPHCGPGSLDTKDTCGFCGENVLKCARRWSRACKKDPSARECGETCCGGSGLWCSGCGRFWAQDSCGECFFNELKAADGAELTLDGEQVICCCGKPLFRTFET